MRRERFHPDDARLERENNNAGMRQGGEGVKYPKVKVKLVGEEGNAFFIVGKVAKALRRAGVSEEEVKQFQKEAFRGDYNELLSTCLEWVNVS